MPAELDRQPSLGAPFRGAASLQWPKGPNAFAITRHRWCKPLKFVDDRRDKHAHSPVRSRHIRFRRITRAGLMLKINSDPPEKILLGIDLNETFLGEIMK
jgi:hypothetical protein